MDGKVVVEVKDLLKVYGDGHQIHALDHVSFSVRAGEFVSVMGPSGCGKSTLLNMLGALDRPTSGQVTINGQDMGTLRDVDSFRAKTVGFVFQLHNLIPTLSSAENVEVPMQGQGLSPLQRRKRAGRFAQPAWHDDFRRHARHEHRAANTSCASDERRAYRPRGHYRQAVRGRPQDVQAIRAGADFRRKRCDG